MAVAVKNTPESQTRTALTALVPASIVGAAFIIGCAAIVFWGVPYLWDVGIASHLPEGLSFVSYAGLIVVEAVTIAILAFVGMAFTGPAPPRGLRAGVFTMLVGLAVIFLVTISVGRLLDGWYQGALASRIAALLATGMARDEAVASATAALQTWRMIGAAVTAAVGLGLLYWGWTLLSRPKAPDRLRAFEDQGWFSAERLKPMQGQRVRRATMLGIILLVAAGIYSLYSHGTLNTAAKDWVVRIPFTADRYLFLLPDVKYTVPLLIAAAGLWLAFRVVHLPVFADFLIATEAELNKVSWPTRKSVVQDTIVVLTTVLLLTVFLFLVDIGWGALLSWKYVGVIRQSQTPQNTQQLNVEKTPY
jgi:preprotein translocase SecE subunit